MRFTVSILFIVLNIVDGSNRTDLNGNADVMTDKTSVLSMIQNTPKSILNRIEIPEIPFISSFFKPKPILSRSIVSTDCICGLAKRTSRIINGQDTNKNEYPWQVGLKQRKKMNLIYCGGSIISSKSIATAAHCLFGFNRKTKKYYQYKITHIVVVVAEHDVTRTDGELHYKVCLGAIHPNYNPYKEDYDYAILTLCDELQWYRHVKPVCLPTTSEPHSRYANRNAVVSGWGVTDSYLHRKTPDKLQKIWVKTMTNAECCAHSKYRCNQITSRMICAIGNNTDSCIGDSGGPLAVEDSRRKFFTLVGIVSWGGQRCNDVNSPGVYARVTYQLNWILSHTTGSMCQTP